MIPAKLTPEQWRRVQRGMTISERHSIARVVRAMGFAERQHFNVHRAVCLWIDCLKWLGRWGRR